jgi:Uma2 family endonuclease
MALEQDSRRLTFNEYLSLPEGHYQLIEGYLIVTPAPSLRHQTLQWQLLAALGPYARDHQLGHIFGAPCDVLLREGEPAVVVQPDVLLVATGGRAELTEARVVGPPDLVVEILSPGNARLDSVKKRALYEEHGVLEYWMVLPDLEQVEVLRRDINGKFGRPAVFESDDTLTTPLLPGFELPVRQLFQV